MSKLSKPFKDPLSPEFFNSLTDSEKDEINSKLRLLGMGDGLKMQNSYYKSFNKKQIEDIKELSALLVKHNLHYHIYQVMSYNHSHAKGLFHEHITKEALYKQRNKQVIKILVKDYGLKYSLDIKNWSGADPDKKEFVKELFTDVAQKQISDCVSKISYALTHKEHNKSIQFLSQFNCCADFLKESKSVVFEIFSKQLSEAEENEKKNYMVYLASQKIGFELFKFLINKEKENKQLEHTFTKDDIKTIIKDALMFSNQELLSFVLCFDELKDITAQAWADLYTKNIISYIIHPKELLTHLISVQSKSENEKLFKTKMHPKNLAIMESILIDAHSPYTPPSSNKDLSNVKKIIKI